MLQTLSREQQEHTYETRRQVVGTAVEPMQKALNRYGPISLDEMAGVALLNRIDTKFVMGTGTLLDALQRLHSHYRVLEISGVRLHPYQTLYFDTAGFALYHRHHAGAYDRYKVRSRAYINSGLSFFEVKHKTNKKRTIKDRLQTPQLQTHVNRETASFLVQHYPYEPAELLPALWNSFIRITLVSNHRPERLTLDFDLSFQMGAQRIAWPGIAIAEVKREGFSAPSDFVQQIRLLGVPRTSFSKYCMGASALYPQLKQNNFKPKHLLVQKLNESGFPVSQSYRRKPRFIQNMIQGESHGRTH